MKYRKALWIAVLVGSPVGILAMVVRQRTGREASLEDRRGDALEHYVTIAPPPPGPRPLPYAQSKGVEHGIRIQRFHG